MTVYLIGGPARVGKSTIHRMVRGRIAGDTIEVDPVKRAIERWARPEIGDPLRLAPRIDDHEPDNWVTLLRVRDHAIWSGLCDWICEHQYRHGGDLLMTGCLWPDDVAELRGLEFDHRAVFVVDSGPHHAERLVAATGSGWPNDWQAGRDEAHLRRWAEYNRHRSHAYLELAHGPGRYPVVDISDFDGTAHPQAEAEYAAAISLGLWTQELGIAPFIHAAAEIPA